MGAFQSLHVALHVPTAAHATSGPNPKGASWGLFVGPPSKPKTPISGTLNYASSYGHREIAYITPGDEQEPYILLLVTVAKVAKAKGPRGLPNVLETVSAERMAGGGKLWTKEALQALNSAGCLGGRKETGWPVVEQEVNRFLAKKATVGRWRAGQDGKGKWTAGDTPTWDLMQGKEVVG